MTGVVTKTVDAAQGRIQGRGGWVFKPPPPLGKKLPSLLINWRYTEGQTVPNRPTP